MSRLLHTMLILSSLLFVTQVYAESDENSVKEDERAIKALFDNWITATTEGNLNLAQQAIADDAIFLVPGVGVMDKMTFAQAAAGESPEDSPMIYDLSSNIREIRVIGEYAYLWSESELNITPKQGGDTVTMAGHSLSVLQKIDGHWQIIRDANTITAVSDISK